jgi:hypothetical protein
VHRFAGSALLSILWRKSREIHHVFRDLRHSMALFLAQSLAPLQLPRNAPQGHSCQNHLRERVA